MNFVFLARLTGVLRGHAEDARALATILRDQLDGRTGLYGDEFGGGYAPIQDRAVLCVLRHARNGAPVPAELVTLCRRWYGASLRMAVLLAVPHRDSVLVIGPGARLRSRTADGLGLPLTETIGAPPRRYGIGRDSRPDEIAWEWRDADDQAAELRKLMGVPPAALAVECGVGDLFLRGVVEGRAANALLAEQGLRSLHPLRIRRYRSGDLAAWWPEFTSGDAPHAGATSIGGVLHTLQPQPIGPRAGTDTQHWGGSEIQRCEIVGGELVATFRTSRGLTRPSGVVVEQVQRVPLPAGEVALDLVIDLDGAREVRGEQPAPRPPSPAPPRLEPAPPSAPPPAGEDELVATRAQGREILAFVDRMMDGTAGPGASARLRRMVAGTFRL